jgi:exodeoxyribonuclease V beta subunit
MSAVVALDWRRLPLDEGRALIEASAGTGKTWTIGAIFLRLLLERGLRVEQILVVTFTDAAAQELRERLRRRLADAEQWLEHRTLATDDPVAGWLRESFVDEAAVKQALRRIRIARMDFDRAPIATIHALCQRIQNDFPLEAGAGFAAANRLDENALLRECVDDFWRLRYLGNDVVDANEADAVFDKGPDGLLRDLGELLRHDARVLPADGLDALAQVRQNLARPEAIAQMREIAATKSMYAVRKTALRDRLVELTDMLDDGVDVHEWILSDKCKVLTVDGIREQFVPDVEIEKYPVLLELQRLRKLSKQRNSLLRGKVLADAYAYCREQMPLRATQRQGQTFSMLIEAVHARVNGEHAHLADSLHKAFPVALIDEFQDTDTRQFEIFDRIYRAADRTPRGLLILIGDPKQAIYGFRGGDIAAYQRARGAITRRFDLIENFRSSKPLIDSCNAEYGAAGNVFGEDDVRYVPVRPGRMDGKSLTRSGESSPPFVIHEFAKPDTSRSNKGDLEEDALSDCAARICELLNDATLRIGDAPVKAGDIAVLLPRNSQIGKLCERLRALGVPCTGSGKDGVFESETARELELILHAVLHPGDDRAARGALSTILLGARFSDLRRWQDDTAAFAQELDRFAHWNALARQRGAMGVIADILDFRAPALLALPEGERIVADLRHLGELLAAREADACGLEAALAWFASMRRGETGLEVSSDQKLRSDTDSACVQLMTLHAAKGLEFPIVFLPLAWHVASRDGRYVPKVLRFHVDGETCMDVGSAQFEEHLQWHFAEDLRERMRLLYVGITRAKYAVHVYWVVRESKKGSPLWDLAAIDRMLFAAQSNSGLTAGEASLPALARTLGDMQVVEPWVDAGSRYANPKPDVVRAARKPLPTLRAFQWSHSFTSITRRRVVDSLESAVADESESLTPGVPDIEDAQPDAPHPELLALDAWGGPQFGVAVHALLEAAPSQALTAAQMVEQLEAAGVRPRGEDRGTALAALGGMLDRVRGADLGEGLRLAELTPDARVAEFGFRLPVSVPVSTLRAICAEHDASDVWPEHIAMAALNGMLTGFADLIFVHAGRYHVLDYKTNRLGERVSDYCGQGLRAAMDTHHYPLQALLYTIALHRYLRRRLHDYAPERHLGDSVYLFLRGVGLAPEAGVWRRRWPVGLIEALDEAFAGEGQAA